jgi:hypothetical protein
MAPSKVFWQLNPIAASVASTRQASGRARSLNRYDSIRIWSRSLAWVWSMTSVTRPAQAALASTSRANGSITVSQITCSLSIKRAVHW